MADMTTMEQAQQVMGALGYPTLALPQTIKPVTNTKTTIQGVRYDPDKWQALMTALGRPTVRKSKWESLANALAATPEARSFTGAYGTEVINPWAMGLSSLARGFGSVYGDRLASAREAELKDQENALKAAQLDAEATKQAITREIEDTNMKVNDPNAKQIADTQEKLKNLQLLDGLANQLEDIGTRFDEDFKNIDEMQKYSTRFGRSMIGGFGGWGTTAGEKLARDQFDAWKGSMKNVLVNANRQAGSGSMSDADAARYEQNIGNARTPAEARNILQSFVSRMQMSVMPNQNTNNQSETDAMTAFMKGTK